MFVVDWVELCGWVGFLKCYGEWIVFIWLVLVCWLGLIEFDFVKVCFVGLVVVIEFDMMFGLFEVWLFNGVSVLIDDVEVYVGSVSDCCKDVLVEGILYVVLIGWMVCGLVVIKGLWCVLLC